MSEPLMPYLLDIVTAPEAEELILTGGLGLRLKQAFRKAAEERALISSYPESRATQDMDFFLQLSMFVEPAKGIAFRDFLLNEGYEPVEGAQHFHFVKRVDQGLLGPMEVKVDLLARQPLEGENVRVKGPRVGSGIDLHGRITPEAFSLEEQPLLIPLVGHRSDGTAADGASVLVPHAYTWLNLKIQAAHDWLIRNKPGGQKHVLDVYILTAMLTPDELDQSAALALKYREHPAAQSVREACRELFGSADSPGCREILRQGVAAIDEAFFEGLQTALGLEPQSGT